MTPTKRLFASLGSGILFGAGLAVSQMINPMKIMDFLDFFGSWDPSLALVMASALAVTALGFRWALRSPQPVFDSHFRLPTAKEIDGKLILGAAIFGIGWGLAGYCPGPGVAAMSLAIWEPFIFTLAVLAGFHLQRLLSGA